jgi:hypothetical protein
MAEARTVGITIRRSLASRSVEILHPEKVRGDKGVPPSVTKNSRFERFQRARRRHEKQEANEKRFEQPISHGRRMLSCWRKSVFSKRKCNGSFQ